MPCTVRPPGHDAGVTELVLAPAKLTLSLRITGVRADGYHLIDAEMVDLDLADELEIRPASTTVVDYVSDDGRAFAVDPDADLVRRALALAGRTAQVRVHKVIPAGAGLGGGSSDAAAVLRWCGFDDVEASAAVGADVPFCLVGGRARVRGIGELVERLEPVATTLTLLTPPFGCATPAVYRAWDAMGGPTGEAGNDLEPAALEVEPRLGRWRDELAEATGQRPRLAGSGSTWFVEGAHAGPGRLVVRTRAR